jgi:hypothetical protein
MFYLGKARPRLAITCKAHAVFYMIPSTDTTHGHLSLSTADLQLVVVNENSHWLSRYPLLCRCKSSRFLKS